MIELTFEQRVLAFWSKVDKNAPIPPAHPTMSNCWLWEGAKNHKNYGTFCFPENDRQRFLKAHRVAWFLSCGLWPKGVIDHLCHVTLCVRPSHLRDVSQRENCNNRARTICIRGHPLADPNLYHYKSHGHPKHRCLTCWKAEQVRSKALRHAAKAAGMIKT